MKTVARLILLFKTARASIIDLLFPISCCYCGEEGRFICQKCQQAINPLQAPVCPICRQLSDQGQVCGNCAAKTSINGLIVAASYGNKVLQTAITSFKYKFVSDLADYLGNILVSSLEKIRGDKKTILDDFIIIPVPLHPKRIAWRGFNQAEVLARYLSGRLGLIMRNDLLKRVRFTKAQMSLGRQERLVNLKEAFIGEDKNFIANKKFLLVDDVYTTGATMEECAKELKRLGAEKVWGIVLARGEN